MSAFHEVRFSLAMGLGSSGGPERLTEIVTLASGREERNTPWADSRRRWDVGPAVKTLSDLDGLIAFFEARRGQLHGFRFRDPLDHRSCPAGHNPSATDQRLGEGDGLRRNFDLIKRYESGGETWQRPIRKPDLDSLMIAVDGAQVGFSFDDAGGEIHLDQPPPDGAEVTAGYLFDCPVRFDSDRLDIALDHIAAGTVSVPLIELRL